MILKNRKYLISKCWNMKTIKSIDLELNYIKKMK